MQTIAFYGQFIKKGDLVFDVGANIGMYAEMFLSLGAHVIAFEPNPDLIPVLHRVRPKSSVTVEWTGLGGAVGEADLSICAQDGLSTISSDRMNTLKSDKRYDGIRSTRTARVPVTTLDAMIAKYGTPAFIKIDVEGFEREVLAGLSALPSALSFEFQSDSLELAISCIHQKCFAPSARFNLILGNPLGWKPRPIEFALDQWVTAEVLDALLREGRIVEGVAYGEIFARATE